MEFNVFLAFVTATAIMISLPGPSVLLVVAHSISYGWQRALLTVAGTTTGIAVQLFIAAVGLSSLLHTAADVFVWLRWAGAAYLVYLGIKQWRSADAPIALDASSASRANLFTQGLVVTIPNPKSLIFIAAFLPQFLDATRSATTQFAVVVPTFLLITFIVTGIWALAAGKARGYLRKQNALKPVFRAAGGMMILSGVGLAMARRSS